MSAAEPQAAEIATNASSRPAQAKRPRRFQIGLREAIIYMVILSAVFGLLGRAIDRMRRQERVISYLHSRGFRVDYHEPVGLTRLVCGISYDEWPEWQRHMLLEVEGAYQTSRFFSPATQPEEDEFWRNLTQLPALETLSVSKSLSTGLHLDLLPSRRRLKWLYWQAPLSSQEIEQVSRCSELLSLDIRVEPSAAAALDRLSRLEKLKRLSTTTATPEAVEAWSTFTRLEAMFIRDASQVPGVSWGKLLARNPALVQLALCGCTSTAQACAGLEESQYLSTLDLSGSDADDEALSLLRSLPRLERLLLDRTQVTGIGFEPVSPHDWKELKVISLSRSKINAAGLEAFAKMRQVPDLDLSHNSLDDAVFANLPTELPFVSIDVSDNDITDATIERLAIGGAQNIYAKRTFGTERFAMRAWRRWPARGMFVRVIPMRTPPSSEASATSNP